MDSYLSSIYSPLIACNLTVAAPESTTAEKCICNTVAGHWTGSKPQGKKETDADKDKQKVEKGQWK